MLRIGDVEEAVETRLMGRVDVRAENVPPALEVMSRFAVDPRWLVYLPPTMAPADTSSLDGFLEHPAEAFAAYRKQGVERVVCEEKHMGSRAVVVVARDAGVAAARFGVDDGTTGAVHTRTGRPFFADPERTEEFLARVRAAAGFLFDELDTGWLVLDCELMPWSAKAVELLRDQYAATGAAARTALPVAAEVLARAAARGLDVAELRERVERRTVERRPCSPTRTPATAGRRRAWRACGWRRSRCWPGRGTPTPRATTCGTWRSRTAWPRPTSCSRPTRSRVVDLSADEAPAVDWWQELTAGGGEGMVVKPLGPSRPGPDAPAAWSSRA